MGEEDQLLRLSCQVVEERSAAQAPHHRGYHLHSHRVPHGAYWSSAMAGMWAGVLVLDLVVSVLTIKRTWLLSRRSPAESRSLWLVMTCDGELKSAHWNPVPFP